MSDHNASEPKLTEVIEITEVFKDESNGSSMFLLRCPTGTIVLHTNNKMQTGYQFPNDIIDAIRKQAVEEYINDGGIFTLEEVEALSERDALKERNRVLDALEKETTVSSFNIKGYPEHCSGITLASLREFIRSERGK